MKVLPEFPEIYLEELIKF